MAESNVTKSALESLPCTAVLTILEELYSNLVQLRTGAQDMGFDDVRRRRLEKIISALEGYLLDCADNLNALLEAPEAS